MPQVIEKLSLETTGKQIINITQKIRSKLDSLDLKNGLLNLTVLHTSSSLMIQENADPRVLEDLTTFLDKIAPEGDNYAHDDEGLDDMPAHIKSSLTNNQISLSIKDGNLLLGTWQGLYLFEHRLDPQSRKIVLHYLGD